MPRVPRGRLLLAAAGCLAALLAAGIAAADDTGTDEARRLFDAALAHVEAGEFAQAATAFRAAYLIKPNWRVLYNIAEAEQKAGSHARALEVFTLYLVEGGDEIPAGQQRAIRKTVERLDKLVGFLLVKCPAAGAVVLIDGRRQGVTPLLGPALVDAGDHEVVIVKGGQELHRQNLRVAGGQLSWVVVDAAGGRDYAATGLAPFEDREPDPEPEPQTDPAAVAEPAAEPEPEVAREPAPAPPAEPAPEPPPLPERTSTLGTWTWVALGTGVAAGLTAIASGSAALSGARAVEAACDGDSCPASQLAEAERVRTLAVTTDVLLGVSAAALVTGGILLLVGRRGERPEEEVAVAPAAGSGGGMLVLRGRF
jgi:hypothetical protein